MKKTMILEITYDTEYGDKSAVIENILESVGIVRVKVLKKKEECGLKPRARYGRLK